MVNFGRLQLLTLKLRTTKMPYTFSLYLLIELKSHTITTIIIFLHNMIFKITVCQNNSSNFMVLPYTPLILNEFPEKCFLLNKGFYLTFFFE